MPAVSIQSKLIPFENTSESNRLNADLTVELQRSGSILSIQYLLKGEVQKILFSTLAATPMRMDYLWQHTCFEAFLTWENCPFYWELNVAPSGDWNFYRFNHYRTGQIQEAHATVSHRVIEPSQGQDRFQDRYQDRYKDQWRNEIIIDLAGILPQDHPVILSVGLTAVLESIDHTKSYWAVKHCGQKPDFHLRESFVLKI